MKPATPSVRRPTSVVRVMRSLFSRASGQGVNFSRSLQHCIKPSNKESMKKAPTGAFWNAANQSYF